VADGEPWSDALPATAVTVAAKHANRPNCRAGLNIP
jgi:hypothetical protein